MLHANTRINRGQRRSCAHGVAQVPSSREADRVQSLLCIPACRCCAPCVSRSSEEQAQPLNFPRLLSGCHLGSSWLVEKHGGRWRIFGCAGMLDRVRRGLNAEWFWASTHLSKLDSWGVRKRGLPGESASELDTDWCMTMTFIKLQARPYRIK